MTENLSLKALINRRLLMAVSAASAFAKNLPAFAGGMEPLPEANSVKEGQKPMSEEQSTYGGTGICWIILHPEHLRTFFAALTVLERRAPAAAARPVSV